jgi:hypothetical protein
VPIRRLRQAELAEDGADVCFHGLLGQPQVLGDAGVRVPLGHESEHFPVARSQGCEYTVVLRRREQVLDDFGIQCLTRRCVPLANARTFAGDATPAALVPEGQSWTS